MTRDNNTTTESDNYNTLSEHDTSTTELGNDSTLSETAISDSNNQSVEFVDLHGNTHNIRPHSLLEFTDYIEIDNNEKSKSIIHSLKPSHYICMIHNSENDERVLVTGRNHLMTNSILRLPSHHTDFSFLARITEENVDSVRYLEFIGLFRKYIQLKNKFNSLTKKKDDYSKKTTKEAANAKYGRVCAITEKKLEVVQYMLDMTSHFRHVSFPWLEFGDLISGSILNRSVKFEAIDQASYNLDGAINLITYIKYLGLHQMLSITRPNFNSLTETLQKKEKQGEKTTQEVQKYWRSRKSQLEHQIDYSHKNNRYLKMLMYDWEHEATISRLNVSDTLIHDFLKRAANKCSSVPSVQEKVKALKSEIENINTENLDPSDPLIGFKRLAILSYKYFLNITIESKTNNKPRNHFSDLVLYNLEQNKFLTLKNFKDISEQYFIERLSTFFEEIEYKGKEDRSETYKGATEQINQDLSLSSMTCTRTLLRFLGFDLINKDIIQDKKQQQDLQKLLSITLKKEFKYSGNDNDSIREDIETFFNCVKKGEINKIMQIVSDEFRNPKLIEKDRLHMNFTTEKFKGNTALHFALENRQFGTAYLLILLGADLRATNDKGITPTQLLYKQISCQETKQREAMDKDSLRKKIETIENLFKIITNPKNVNWKFIIEKGILKHESKQYLSVTPQEEFSLYSVFALIRNCFNMNAESLPLTNAFMEELCEEFISTINLINESPNERPNEGLIEFPIEIISPHIAQDYCQEFSQKLYKLIQDKKDKKQQQDLQKLLSRTLKEEIKYSGNDNDSIRENIETFFNCVKKGEINKIMQIVSDEFRNPNLREKDRLHMNFTTEKFKGNTALHFALENRQFGTAYLLILLGADLKAENDKGIIPTQLLYAQIFCQETGQREAMDKDSLEKKIETIENLFEIITNPENVNWKVIIEEGKLNPNSQHHLSVTPQETSSVHAFLALIRTCFEINDKSLTLNKALMENWCEEFISTINQINKSTNKNEAEKFREEFIQKLDRDISDLEKGTKQSTQIEDPRIDEVLLPSCSNDRGVL